MTEIPIEKKQVLDLLKSIETGDPTPADYINPTRYVQHNPGAGDDLEGFKALLQQLPPKSAKVNTVRIFQDDNFVFAHTDYNFFGPKIGFDIFRYKNGKIVEHWDNLQEKPINPNPSNRTMTDGTAEIKDVKMTAINKKLVKEFVEDILVNGKMEKLTDYFTGDSYIQHNPAIADGLSGLGKAIEAMAAQGIIMKYNKVHYVLGEGNFVLTVSEGSFADKHSSFYDLFRIENDKIAEHWDTIEPIPDKSAWKNSNGKF